MAPLRIVAGRATSRPQADVDTDVIFPARYLTITRKRGLGRYAFADRPDMVLVEEVPILIGGDNFGCGSSREQAVWALADLGIRVIVAPGFGEIFQTNCCKNGILPIVLPSAEVDRLRTADTLIVDLETQQIHLPESVIAFWVDPARREALLEGLDEIARIRTRFAPAIAAFEARQRASSPWLWTPTHA